ncbi:D-amino acid dehydrogenase [Pseudohoeflea coraliihabitans]|uniref:D-amino acid dehydrogenase n=1 Tax=Pseudohoeflea coraliihabitans TaxID=2860393 RepID=A0ABS6WKG5_9HYPH|nr:D-amino acid dehydrogenase [Pseudohoeflea sp. DP4N28-3]MBW3096424.1 D-amino acid dehydrogenase [Pseudohoeflea sp. DP4N28-3]
MTSSSKHVRIAVIGAGITGTTTAYRLNKQGHAVTLFDRHPFAAMETSYANGGQLSASNAEVWTSWRTVRKGLTWMLRPGAPLHINPMPSWHKLSWMAEFLAAIPHYEDNTVATVKLALAARDHLGKWAEEENIDFSCERRGILHFYRSRDDFEVARNVTQLLARGGLQRRAVTPSEMSAIEPALQGTFYGGYYTESDFTGDIHAFTTGLAQAFARNGGTLRFGTEIIDVRSGRDGVQVETRIAEGCSGAETVEAFDRIVICSGVMSRQLARRLGDRVNIYPVKGYSITVNLAGESDRRAAPWTSLLDDDAKIVASRLGAGRFRVAGTAEFNGDNRDISAARIAQLTDWCRRYFPEMSTRDVVPWAGLRPMMPNMMPKVGRGANPRVYYNTGHGHLGWTLSAATAEAVTAMMEAA